MNCQPKRRSYKCQ